MKLKTILNKLDNLTKETKIILNTIFWCYLPIPFFFTMTTPLYVVCYASFIGVWVADLSGKSKERKITYAISFLLFFLFFFIFYTIAWYIRGLF